MRPNRASLRAALCEAYERENREAARFWWTRGHARDAIYMRYYALHQALGPVTDQERREADEEVAAQAGACTECGSPAGYRCTETCAANTEGSARVRR